MKNSYFIKTGLMAAILACMLQPIKGQDFSPFANDNYSGISGVHLNPASIANSRYIVDIELFGLNLDFHNNYGSFNLKDVTSKLIDGGDYPLFWPEGWMKENLNGKKKWLTQSSSVSALNFMFSINSKWAIGVTGRVREFVNLNNVDEDILSMVLHERALTDHFYNGLTDRQYQLENFGFNATAFAEYGLTLAGVLWESDNHHHFLKFGFSGHLLQGLGSAYINSSDAVAEFYNKDSLGVWGDKDRTTPAYISFGVSDEFLSKDYYTNYKNNNFLKRFGASFDLGFVYEWRPDYDKYVEERDCKVGEMKYENKYKLRIGLSVTDIGWITYKKGMGSRDFLVQGRTNIDRDFANMNSSIEGIISRIDELIATNPAYSEAGDNSETYRTMLPTAISLQVDWHVWKSFYLNFTPFIALNQGNIVKNNKSKIFTATVVSLTPRFEFKWFGVAVPLQYNQVSSLGFTVGLGLRLGPIWIGSSDLLSSFVKGDFYGTNIQMAAKIPIMYRKLRDRDGDHISDRYDKCKDIWGICQFQGCPDTDGDGIPDAEDGCPTVAGIAAFKGCPDTDGDGIEDRYDECPEVAGLPQFHGCPDTDGDGIEDRYDECPDVPGLAEFNGCPDTDGDGIPDKDDDCPDVAGLPQFKGCPDTDGDGIPDKDDDCPDVAGLPEFKGCPDTDGDGVPDNLDQCPTVPGPASNNGCPVKKKDSDGDGVPDDVDECPKVPGLAIFNGCPDTDGDGIPDHLDECPTEPGPIENHGCPVKIPIEFADKILFQTGKATLVPSCYSILDSLTSILNEHPECYLTVDGHTDNVGKKAANLTLSQKRADAIKNYLVDQGIDPHRVVSTGFGDTKPVADNKTAEGKAKNRRTEINLVTPYEKK